MEKILTKISAANRIKKWNDRQSELRRVRGCKKRPTGPTVVAAMVHDPLTAMQVLHTA